MIEFDAELDPAQLLAKLRSRGKSPLGGGANPLEGLGEAVGTPGRGGSEPAITKFELEVFIAPNGLPVRTRVTVESKQTTVSFRVDTLATGVPVNVQAPPAKRVITEAALTRIERRRAARLGARLRRCSHSHNPAKCLRGVLRGPPEGGPLEPSSGNSKST